MTFWNVSAAWKSQLSHQSGLNNRINTVLLGRTVAVRKADAAVGIAIVTSSMTFLCLYISRWWRQTWDAATYFTVVNQSKARISAEHGINNNILMKSSKRSYLEYSVHGVKCVCAVISYQSSYQGCFGYWHGYFGRTRFREIWVLRWVSDGYPILRNNPLPFSIVLLAQNGQSYDFPNAR